MLLPLKQFFLGSEQKPLKRFEDVSVILITGLKPRC